MKLNIGGGDWAQTGYTNVDINPKYADICLDLEKGLYPQFEENSIDALFSRHCLEHITNLIPLMQDCYKILKPGGLFEIIVPSGHSPVWSGRDPGHVRYIYDQTFLYFTKTDLVPSYCDFELVKLERIERRVKAIENKEFIGEDIHAILRKP